MVEQALESLKLSASVHPEEASRLVMCAIRDWAEYKKPIPADVLAFAEDPVVMDTVWGKYHHSARFEAAAYGAFHLGVTRDHARLRSKWYLETPLYRACCWGRYDAVVGLVNLGADIHDVRDEKGHAIDFALVSANSNSSGRQVEIVAFLLERGADWRNMLCYVVQEGLCELLRCMIDPNCYHRLQQRGPLSQPLPPPGPRDLDEPLCLAFVRWGDECGDLISREMITMLVRSGASVRTALRRWLSESHNSIVKFFGFLNNMEDVTDVVRSIADDI